MRHAERRMEAPDVLVSLLLLVSGVALSFFLRLLRRSFDHDAMLSLSTAVTLAHAHGHDELTLAHVTLALLPDPRVAEHLEARGVRVKEIYDAVEALLPPRAKETQRPPHVDERCASVLAFRGHTSLSSCDLLASILRNDDAIRAVFERHGVDVARWRDRTQRATAIDHAETPDDRAPYRAAHREDRSVEVVFWNDDRTPMQFVIDVLRGTFGLREAHAIRVMLVVHTRGSAVVCPCGSDEGERLVAIVREAAARRGYPLRATSRARSEARPGWRHGRSSALIARRSSIAR